MFTGIVEELGTVSTMKQSGDAMKLTIQARFILSDIKIGDSIAVNGICLTATSFTESHFTVDVMPETMKSTSLRMLKQHSQVNLERAMAANGRFGGHFVTGHIDGTGTIVSKKQHYNAIYYKIKMPNHLLRYCLQKGSIAIDGTSLTIFDVDDNSITISLIPHTVSESIIGTKEAGDIVNIECDMIGKYIEQFMSQPTKRNNSVTESFLHENGFL
ncbi:riboflavin synthase [Bacillus cytotoxicus]|uniref:Riboflavin synthase n=1 Tax=Bacillus cytotoxicus (strain DSM 22905 / CIP 110041 / 391-98 / NVH 391-98) TaxID=315749 RepID=A7GSD4_BACCN|nr:MULTISPECIES: riboflavin synthase [Bacillus cereus group]ABS23042.1 riboflavin synthase, alpha subunit [Bacillus cytotoxicus NVH 391-98]AWC45672.1 riboflavin synthase [Bacillus cytotoxicus]MDH2863445.1 riboflavin synthase [Bacillus cytotoxicus]MDH2884231.1 riboflavin synthase [Bacillus cytotoxicus]MDH2887244.1 riboflavin synthase [Bacillus cytotoxicus]